MFLRVLAGFAAATAVLVFTIMALGFRIGFDVQKLTDGPRCLNYWLFLIDTKTRKSPVPGDYVMALMPDTKMSTGAKEGTRVVKQVVASSGDLVKIEGTELYINGVHQTNDRLWLAKSIPGKSIGDFDAVYELSSADYFLMGTNKESFDSRYFGPFKRESIIGIAYPIL